jgi:citrate synthase
MTTSNEIYSPGLEGVIAGETAISTMTGGLRHRGYPVQELTDKTTFLYQLRGTKPAPADSRALDVSLILYAEHEFNASTFTARLERALHRAARAQPPDPPARQLHRAGSPPRAGAGPAEQGRRLMRYCG